MNDKYRLTLSEEDIYALLNQLGIVFERGVNNKGWISCSCLNPMHKDSNPSGSINIHNYKVKCFSCKYDTNLTSAIGKMLGLSYHDAFSYINNRFAPPPSSFQIRQSKAEPKVEIKKEPEKQLYTITTKLIPENFKYTLDRGFTDQFIKKYKIEHCLSGLYSDYMMIPVIDEEFGVNTFEFRKLKQFEVLNKLGIKDWKAYKEENELKYSKFKVYQFDSEVYNPNIIYLSMPKTLYIKNTNIQDTIFNHSGLDYKLPLDLCEGFGSLPKMLKVNSNSSCSFGTELTKNQIEILQRFKEINVVPDNDLASYKFINKLSDYHPNINVYDMTVDDTDSMFETQLRTSNILKSREFLLSRVKAFTT